MVKVYQYSELSEKAKEKARDWYLNATYGCDWSESIYDDAKDAGLKITGFNIDHGNYCNIGFIGTPEKTAEYILKNHGSKCETYTDTQDYNKAIAALALKHPSDDERNSDEYAEALAEVVEEYKNALARSYLVMLRKEYEYLTSEECIAESMEANNYEFCENGTRF